MLAICRDCGVLGESDHWAELAVYCSKTGKGEILHDIDYLPKGKAEWKYWRWEGWKVIGRMNGLYTRACGWKTFGVRDQEEKLR